MRGNRLLTLTAAFIFTASAQAETPEQMQNYTTKAVEKRLISTHSTLKLVGVQCEKKTNTTFSCAAYLKGPVRYMLYRVNYNVVIDGNKILWTVSYIG